MIGYNILEIENIPGVLKNKPRWVTCVVFAGGILLITLSAVTIGVVIGYTYCYFEHRSIIRTGNITQLTNFQIFHLPLVNEDVKHNRTINGALSNVFIKRLLKLGQTFMDNGSDDRSPYMFQ